MGEILVGLGKILVTLEEKSPNFCQLKYFEKHSLIKLTKKVC